MFEFDLALEHYIKPVSIGVGVISILAGFFSPLVLAFWLFVAGFAFTVMYMKHYENGIPSFWRVQYRFQPPPPSVPTTTKCQNCGVPNCTRQVIQDHTLTHPWEGISISSALDERLCTFIQRLLDSYVRTWYTNISDDESALDEMRVEVRFLVASAIRRFQKVDITSFLLRRGVPIVRDYVLACNAALREVRAQQQPGVGAPPGPGNAAFDQAFVRAVIRQYQGGHAALRSKAVHDKYFRKLLDHILPSLVSKQLLESRPFLVLLREGVISFVLSPTLELLSDPDFLNVKFAQALSPAVAPLMMLDAQTHPVPLLAALFSATSQHSAPTRPTASATSAFAISVERLFSQIKKGYGQELFHAFQSFMKKEHGINLVLAITTLHDFEGRTFATSAELRKEAQSIFQMLFVDTPLPDVPGSRNIVARLREQLFELNSTLRSDLFRDMRVGLEEYVRVMYWDRFLHSDQFFEHLCSVRQTFNRGGTSGAPAHRTRRTMIQAEADIERLKLPPPPSAMDDPHAAAMSSGHGGKGHKRTSSSGDRSSATGSSAASAASAANPSTSTTGNVTRTSSSSSTASTATSPTTLDNRSPQRPTRSASGHLDPHAHSQQQHPHQLSPLATPSGSVLGSSPKGITTIDHEATGHQHPSRPGSSASTSSASAPLAAPPTITVSGAPAVPSSSSSAPSKQRASSMSLSESLFSDDDDPVGPLPAVKSAAETNQRHVSSSSSTSSLTSPSYQRSNSGDNLPVDSAPIIPLTSPAANTTNNAAATDPPAAAVLASTSAPSLASSALNVGAASTGGAAAAVAATIHEEESEELEDSPVKIIEGWKVTITGCERKSATQGDHTEYAIETHFPDKRVVTVSRRYREFWAMDQLIKKFYPDSISSLPEKKRFGRMETSVVEERRVGLAKYLMTLLSLSVVQLDHRCNQVVCSFLLEQENFKLVVRKYDTAVVLKLLGYVPPFWAAKKIVNAVVDVSKRGDKEDQQDSFVKSFIVTTKDVVEAQEQMRVVHDAASALEERPPEAPVCTNFLDALGDPAHLAQPVQGPARSAFAAAREEPLACTSLLDTAAYCLGDLWQDSPRARLLTALLNTLQLAASATVDDFLLDFVADKIAWVLSEPEMYSHLSILLDAVFGTETPPRTPAEKEEARLDAIAQLRGRFPGPLQRLIGMGVFNQSTEDIVYFLQHPLLNKQIALLLLDEILVEMFPFPDSQHGAANGASNGGGTGGGSGSGGASPAHGLSSAHVGSGSGMSGGAAEARGARGGERVI